MAGKITKLPAFVCLVAGNDEYNKDKTVKDLIKRAMPEENRDLNYLEVDCSGTDDFVFDFESTVKTVPFLADRRVIVIREFENLKKEIKNILLEYVKTPSDMTVLILVSGDVKKSEFDKYSIYVTLSKYAEVKVHYKLYENQLASEIKRKFSEFGKTISNDAVDIIVDRVGSNMRDLDSEIEKILLYVGQKKIVDEQDVQFLVSGLDTKGVFDLIGSIGQKNLPKALKAINDIFFMDKYAGPLVVASIYSHYKKLWMAKALMRAGVAENSIAGKMGMHPFFAGAFLTEARSADERHLKNVFNELVIADKEVKGSGSKIPEQVMERLVYKIVK